MHGKGNVFGCLCLQPYGRAAKCIALTFPCGTGPQLLRNEFCKVKAGKGIPGDGELDTGKRVDPAVEMGGKILNRLTALPGATHDRTNDRQRVADAVLQLRVKPLPVIDGLLESGDIPVYPPDAPHLTVLIGHWENTASKPPLRAVRLRLDAAFETDPFPVPRARHAVECVAAILRHNQLRPTQQVILGL